MSSDEVQAAIESLMPREKYFEGRENIFPSAGALDWYIRENRNALIEAGALGLIRTRWLVNALAFDSFVLAKSRVDALARLVEPA